jgi:TRAP-type mannitol/chloroaromatic compound transport system substrate-binding protein
MKKLAAPQDDYIRTAMRLPRDLHAEVRKAAKAAGHTMNAEIIARVAAAEDRPSLKDLMQQNAELKAMMREILDAIELLK